MVHDVTDIDLAARSQMHFSVDVSLCVCSELAL